MRLNNVKELFSSIRPTNNRMFDDVEERLDMWLKVFHEFFNEGKSGLEAVKVVTEEIINFIAPYAGRPEHGRHLRIGTLVNLVRDVGTALARGGHQAAVSDLLRYIDTKPGVKAALEGRMLKDRY